MKFEAVASSGSGTAARVTDFVELMKPRITTMVMVTTTIGFLLAGSGGISVPLLIFTLIGTGMVSAGAAALNQVLERESDGLMKRTAERPLPTGRIDPDMGLLFGVSLSIIGMIELALLVNPLTALLGAAALTGYVFIYTPLKRWTSFATLVGAVPGAIPPLMGWAAVREALDPAALVLFGILFLWQLPHFLSIAWIFRDDYAAAGFPMLPVLEPDGRSTARQALVYGLALVPVSLLPTAVGLTGGIYLFGAAILGLALLWFCVAFSISVSTVTARRLLLASVFYLPAVLAVMLMDRWF